MIVIKGIGKQLSGIMIVFSMFILSSCAAKVAPVESIANAEMALKVAQERNASTFAPLELKIAEDKLNGARAALQKEEFDKAQWLSEEALMDAKLAEVRALSENAKKLTEDMRNSIETLRHEIERTQKKKP